MNELKIGSIIKCRVSGIENYGVFVYINDEYTGLIHISEVSNSFVKDINDFVKLNDEIYCQILEIDDVNKKIKLSIKNINYKTSDDENSIHESRLGFLLLKQALPTWIENTLNEYGK